MEMVLGLAPTVSIDYRRVPAMLAQRQREVTLEEGLVALTV